jgi:ankyrin repeat protein
MHYCTSKEVAELLLAHDADAVKVADSEGLMPLHYAVLRNCLPVICVLVGTHGATGKDSHGMTQLHYAVLHVRVP